MKQLFFLFLAFSICYLSANAQPAIKEAPKGFDLIREIFLMEFDFMQVGLQNK